MELKSRNVQHARNLFDRAVTLLPRVDQLWYKYVYLEELLQNVPGARQVFERWMQWEPDDKAWQAYIKLEERYQELDRASTIYERWIAVRPEPRVWVKWGKFEEDRGRADKAREVFQTALEFYGDEEEQVERAQAVFSAFAKMETRLKEYERARVIYKVRVLAVFFEEEQMLIEDWCSLLLLVFRDQSLPGFTLRIRSLKNSTVREVLLRARCLESDGFSTKRSWLMMDEITMSGSTTLDWKRLLGEISRMRDLQRRSWNLPQCEYARFMRGQWLRFRRAVRRGIGEGIFFCGWITLSLKRLKPRYGSKESADHAVLIEFDRTTLVLVKFTKLRSILFHISNSRLRSCG